MTRPNCTATLWQGKVNLSFLFKLGEDFTLQPSLGYTPAS